MKQKFKKEVRFTTFKLLALGGLALIVILLINSCRHDPFIMDTGNPGGVSGIPGTIGRSCSKDSVYFANDILPMITSGCTMSGCHDAASHKEGVILTTYANIMKHVIPGNAGSSKLYKEIIKTGSERMPPPPMPAWTNEQKNKLLQWINQGAKNNVCDRCDTVDYKYSTAIKTIIQNKCQGCHNPSSLGGGIDLSTYTTVKTVAVNGKLYGSVIWISGYSQMPKGGLKLPDCEIKQIKKWIDAGSPNN